MNYTIANGVDFTLASFREAKLLAPQMAHSFLFKQILIVPK
jgi:hypothetical protein